MRRFATARRVSATHRSSRLLWRLASTRTTPHLRRAGPGLRCGTRVATGRPGVFVAKCLANGLRATRLWVIAIGIGGVAYVVACSFPDVTFSMSSETGDEGGAATGEDAAGAVSGVSAGSGAPASESSGGLGPSSAAGSSGASRVMQGEVGAGGDPSASGGSKAASGISSGGNASSGGGPTSGSKAGSGRSTGSGATAGAASGSSTGVASGSSNSGGSNAGSSTGGASGSSTGSASGSSTGSASGSSTGSASGSSTGSASGSSSSGGGASCDCSPDHLYPTGFRCGQAVDLGALGISCSGPTEGFKERKVSCGETNGSFVVCRPPASVPIGSLLLCHEVGAGQTMQQCH